MGTSEVTSDEWNDKAVLDAAPADAPGFRMVGPLWVNTEMYAELVEDDATVATLTYDSDVAFVDRHGDHYLVVIQNADTFEYLGEFATDGEAVEALRKSQLSVGGRISV